MEGETRTQAANVTHWNSQLKMIRSISKIDKNKLESIPSLNSSFVTTVRERSILEEFIEIMEAFDEVTNRIQGKKNCYCQFCYTVDHWAKTSFFIF